MSINGAEMRTGLDYLADLWSGRIHNTFTKQQEQLSAIWRGIQTIQEILLMKTQAEQALLNAARMLTETESTFREVIGGMQSKIDTLVSQAQSTTSTPQPEDLTEEMSTFETQLSSMRSYANSLKSTASTVAAGEQGGSGTAPTPSTPAEDPASPVVANQFAVDPETGLPRETDPSVNSLPSGTTQDPATPIPLAGETGIGNTPTNNQAEPIELQEGEVFAFQPQPGTDPATQQPSPSSTGIGTSEDPTADASATTNQSASEIEGNAASNTEVGSGGVTPNESSSPSDIETRNAPTSGEAQEGANTVSSSTATTDPEAARSSGIIDESIR